MNDDLAPTVTEVAGVAAGLAVDGRSVVPLFGAERTVASRKRFLVEHWRSRAIAAESPNYSAVRTNRAATSAPHQLYVEYRTSGGSTVYDVRADPFQLNNVAFLSAGSERQRALAFRLDEPRRCSGCGPKPDTRNSAVASV